MRVGVDAGLATRAGVRIGGVLGSGDLDGDFSGGGVVDDKGKSMMEFRRGDLCWAREAVSLAVVDLDAGSDDGGGEFSEIVGTLAVDDTREWDVCAGLSGESVEGRRT